jgi:acetyl-CoA synthetase
MNDTFFRKENLKLKQDANLQSYSENETFSYENQEKDFFHPFSDGKINAAHEVLDIHAGTEKESKKALLWESANGDKKEYTFGDLIKKSNQWANYLKNKNIIKGDRVFIFLPRVPDLYLSFLAILKLGAIAGTMFSAFQPQALEDRLVDSGAKILITNKDLLPRVNSIKDKLPNLKEIIVVDDEIIQQDLNHQPTQFNIEHMDKNDFAFMLYTSGTTGKPKGIVHRHLAILSQHLTAKYILDLKDSDIYWCTADPGWVTGIAYEIMGNWSNGATTVVYEGRFDADKWYQIMQDYRVTVWYTAPTAVRMLMSKGDDIIKKYNLSTLRHILSVGEPLNPEAIRWGIKVFNLAFHDTWWQTETGAMMLVNFPSEDIKIGSMGKPFLGLKASIVDDNGNPVADNTEGNIAIKPGWPSMMQTVWMREEKYKSYFVNDWYISGDRGWRDNEGYFWFVGRADDVIKTSGERVGPFEVESALVSHPAVVEAGVIGKPDNVRGEIVKAFVVLKPEFLLKIQNEEEKTKLKDELAIFVKKNLAGHAYPREIEFIDKLPKTRSGKIMRRILKAKELGQPIGDTSTLEEY